MKAQVLKNDKGLKEGIIIGVVFPDLSEENTYYYAQDNEVNTMDNEGHICLGGEKNLCQIDDSNIDNWLLEEEYKIVGDIDFAECIYCEPHKKCSNDKLHFVCEVCGNGMCDECYDSMAEHDGHYHLPLENCDSDREIELISKACGNDSPDYICETCMNKVLAGGSENE
jgi:hypothetical protein